MLSFQDKFQNYGIIGVLIYELNKKNISGRFCYGKNLTKHKSIPEIEHYHVFIAV